METEQKKVLRSNFYLQDIVDIFEYGSATFGERAGLIFYQDLKMIVRGLETQYLLHPECRHLETKTKIPQHHLRLVPDHLPNPSQKNRSFTRFSRKSFSKRNQKSSENYDLSNATISF